MTETELKAMRVVEGQLELLRNAKCARDLLDAGARIAALEATNAKMWADFDALKATVLANEQEKDAENERLRETLDDVRSMLYREPLSVLNSMRSNPILFIDRALAGCGPHEQGGPG